MTDRLVALTDIQHAVGVIEKGQSFGVEDPDLTETLLRQKSARREFEVVRNVRGWGDLLWDGATVVCMASGPSLTQAQCDRVHAWRIGGDDRRTLAVNTSYQRAPWVDVVYAGDDRWWRFHWDEVSRECAAAQFFATEKTLGNVGAGRIRILPHESLPGLNTTKPGMLRSGGNSGYQALCLAYWAGAKKLILLGYDCHNRGGAHWHGDHPPELRARNQYRFWIQQFERLAEDLRTANIEVVNCSPDSDLQCFTKGAIEEVL